MKKRHKQRGVSAFKSHQSATTSPESILHEARTFPVLECWISKGWDGGGSGLVQDLASSPATEENLLRELPYRSVLLGTERYLCQTNLSPDRYQYLYKSMDSRMKNDQMSNRISSPDGLRID